ncbi:ABC transporter permease [Clostridium botulinum]|nr:ABC transporter permease [Clostridium botulinum]
MEQYIKNFFKYKELLKELVIRDIKVKYRKSVLGYIWSILNPLLMMLVISSVFSYMFRYEIENYPVYLITGQTIYSFFSEATNMSMESIINGGSLLKKVYFPRYIFPVSRILSSFVNLLFSLVAILIILLFTGTPVTPVIFMFPIPLIYIAIIATGFGLILSVLATYFRDVIHLYSVFLTALMYGTPIFYPISSLPDNIINIIKINPLYHVITMFRNVVLYGNMPTIQEHIICMGFSVVLLGFGLVVFKKNQHKLVMYV